MEFKNKKNLLPFFLSTILSIGMSIGFWFLLSKSPVRFLNLLTDATSVLFLVFCSVLQFISFRRYLKRINYDKEAQELKTISVFSFARKTILLDQIEKIHLIKSYGFWNSTKNFRHKNLVIRLHGKIQPLLFEIENIENLKNAETLISRIVNSDSEFLVQDPTA